MSQPRSRVFLYEGPYRTVFLVVLVVLLAAALRVGSAPLAFIMGAMIFLHIAQAYVRERRRVVRHLFIALSFASSSIALWLLTSA